MILEDEALLMFDLEDTLSDLGFQQVEAFPTNQDALAWLENNRPDVAVVDYRLKKETSDQTVIALAALGVPTVVCSGNDFEAGYHSEVFHSLHWVQKPIQPEALKDALRRSVEGQPGPSSEQPE